MDLISRQEVRRILAFYIYELATDALTVDEFRTKIRECINGIPSQNKWIPVTYRELDEDERQMYSDAEFEYDCKLPEDAQDVLITTKYRQVVSTTFYRDAENGCWFDSYEDRDDVLAWMPLPKPYKAESEVEE